MQGDYREINNNPFKGSFGNLENLVDKISDVLKCPVTIEDANHRLLAYSSHDERTDPARIATIIGRRVPEKVINSLWRNGVLPKLVQSEDPIRVSPIDSVGLTDRIAISIHSKNEVIGYIWVLEIDNKLSDADLVLLRKAANSTKNQLLQLQVRKRKREEGFQEFFWQLLTGHLTSQEEIRVTFEQLEIIPPTSFTIILFEFNEPISMEVERHISYLVTITQQVRTVFHCFDGNDIILLCSPLPGKDIKVHVPEMITYFYSQMNKRFSIDNIIGACGNLYEDYAKIETSYQEALQVLRLKKRFSSDLQNTFRYEQLGIYRYLEVLQQKNRVDGYENTSLQKLITYDEQHSTHLVKTLEVFLALDSNANDAAKKLHVHTNTMLYRLKRISEVGDINLKSPDEKITLYLDLKLYNLK